MVLDAFTVAIITLGAGVGFGAANSVFGWLKNNDVFEPKKFAVTVITGILAGAILVFTDVIGVVEIQTELDLLKALAGLAFAIFGINEFRTFISGMIANRAVEKVETQ